MRIDPSTLATFTDTPSTERMGARAARIRQTLLSGLYTIDLDRLAGRLVGNR